MISLRIKVLTIVSEELLININIDLKINIFPILSLFLIFEKWI